MTYWPREFHTFECDDCGVEFESQFARFIDAWEEARDCEDWRCWTEGDAWTHHCGDCMQNSKSFRTRVDYD